MRACLPAQAELKAAIAKAEGEAAEVAKQLAALQVSVLHACSWRVHAACSAYCTPGRDLVSLCVVGRRARAVQTESAARIAALEGSVSSEHLKAVDEVRAAEAAKQAAIVRGTATPGVDAHM